MELTDVIFDSAPIATLTVNRPAALNALNKSVLEQIAQVLREVRHDTSIRVLIVTGAGDRAFVAGADIAAMSKMSTVDGLEFTRLGHRVMGTIEDLPIPVIAAVNGFALGGGCELALACDFIYAGDRARFGQPEVNLAVIPGFGGTQRLARRVGIGRAREMVYTGALVGAEEALQIGLVNAVVPHADLMTKTREVARVIASKGPLAIAAAKRTILRGEDVTLTVANELEATAFSALFGTHDQREGMKAFLEKRAAKFTAD